MPIDTSGKGPCDGHQLTGESPRASLPVLAAHPAGVRKSRTSKWRAAVLIGVHLLIIAHIAHWMISGRTVSPVEPSEAMYTLDSGYLNAGFIFFGLSILATLIFGRYFCGWGCHLIAYQDLCAWLLKKIGIRPKPFRSRILVLAPLALAIYMFVWPSVFRWLAGHPRPELTNHLMTSEFWKTFPGPGIAILTFAVCGFVIIYFLGSKGFCTYGCPYGGFFGLADQVAPGRIRVTDACEHCGHCTATCTSNVRVHEEVAKFGMVVDPGCMKCMDCVSVCPNDALYFGFGKLPRQARAVAKLEAHPLDHQTTKSSNHKITKPPGRYDFTLGEELLMVVVGLLSLLAYRGLYNKIPLLLAMGMAAITAFLIVKFLHVVRSSNVRLQNLQLKRGGRISRAGVGFAVGMVVLLAFTVHSGAVQYQAWRGLAVFKSLDIGDEVWLPGNAWWQSASAEERHRCEQAIHYFGRVDRWGLFATPAILQDAVWAYLAKGDTASAESAVRRLIASMPDEANFHRGLAGVMRKEGRVQEAETAYREAIQLDPKFDRARSELATMLLQAGRVADAVAVYRDGLVQSPNSTRMIIELSRTLVLMGNVEEAHGELVAFVAVHPDAAGAVGELGVLMCQTGDLPECVSHLSRAIDLDPTLTDARYNLALALLSTAETDGGPGAFNQPRGMPQLQRAIEHLDRVVAERPEFAAAHYNLGVAKFMSGRPDQAAPHVRESLRLSPDDPQAQAFLQMLLSVLPD